MEANIAKKALSTMPSTVVVKPNMISNNPIAQNTATPAVIAATNWNHLAPYSPTTSPQMILIEPISHLLF